VKILILTQAEDTHAITVQLALQEMNHHVQLLFTADQPTKLKNSVFISNENFEWKRLDSCNSISDNDYDVIWWRRARKPYLPKDIIHQQDYKFAIRENNLFYESITSNIAPYAWWINSKSAAAMANYKLLQLKKAGECNITIPPTLCSNNATDIRNFILKYENNGVIYKSLCSNTWFEDTSVRFGYTSKVTLADLPKDELLQFVPGIFQKEIKKKYELRVTCFGDYIVAAKLDSQAYPEGMIDWRAIPADKIFPEPYELPSILADKIRFFMKSMGLVFGTLDFIVTEDNNYIFLEVNEQGQFLWLENCNPEFHMLDIFLHFILNKSAQYAWEPHSNMYCLRDCIDYLYGLFGLFSKSF
jgi:glutathione synthase/RimK-type ligase-like ATP-grasp enzyme